MSPAGMFVVRAAIAVAGAYLVTAFFAKGWGTGGTLLLAVAFLALAYGSEFLRRRGGGS